MFFFVPSCVGGNVLKLGFQLEVKECLMKWQKRKKNEEIRYISLYLYLSVNIKKQTKSVIKTFKMWQLLFDFNKKKTKKQNLPKEARFQNRVKWCVVIFRWLRHCRWYKRSPVRCSSGEYSVVSGCTLRICSFTEKPKIVKETRKQNHFWYLYRGKERKIKDLTPLVC